MQIRKTLFSQVLWAWGMVVGVLLLSGCDPIRSTSQKVVFQLRNTKTGKPVSAAYVEAKMAFEEVRKSLSSIDPLEGERLEYFLNAWKDAPWVDGNSDQNGRVVVEFISNQVDRSVADYPDEAKHGMIHKTCIIKISADGSIAEGSIILEPGRTLEAADLNLEIIEVNRPIYRDSTSLGPAYLLAAALYFLFLRGSTQLLGKIGMIEVLSNPQFYWRAAAFSVWITLMWYSHESKTVGNFLFEPIFCGLLGWVPSVVMKNYKPSRPLPRYLYEFSCMAVVGLTFYLFLPIRT